MHIVPARLLLLACCITACGNETRSSFESELREISQDEALADFDQIVSNFKALYGAMERKQQRYGFNFGSLAAEYRARVSETKSEPALRGIYQEFISRFRDAHLSLSPTVISDSSHGYRLPFSVMPIENTFVVYGVADGATGISVGDELLSIDGVTAQAFTESVLKYVSMPSRTAAMHDAAAMLTGRSSYLTAELGKDATIKLRKASGAEATVTLAWTETPHLFRPRPPNPNGDTQAISESTARITEAELAKLGSRVPFFMTDAVRSSLGITAEVKPSAQALAAVQLTAEESKKVDYFAVTYTTASKRVLLVRLGDYQPKDTPNALKYLTALFATFNASSDVLILDQTHNPGGSISFAEGVVALLAKTKFNAAVQAQHADRSWIDAYAGLAKMLRDQTPNDPRADAIEENGRQVDDAYSAKKSLSVPIPFPFSAGATQEDPAAGHWTKGVLVLADELSVSCGDLVPLLVQSNGIGRIFGETTMGGGGSVEEVSVLPNTQMTLALSRGLNTVFDPTGAYPDARFVEDNGVTPDIRRTHTLADFRKGYVSYVQAINAAAVQASP